MSEQLFENKELLCRLILKSAGAGALKKVVFSKPSDKSIKKVVMSLKHISGKDMLQAEIFHTDNKATHDNLALGDAGRIGE